MIRFRTRVHMELKFHKNGVPDAFVLELSGPGLPDQDGLSSAIDIACRKYRRLPGPQRNPRAFASLLNGMLPDCDIMIYMPDYAAENDETGLTSVVNACLD